MVMGLRQNLGDWLYQQKSLRESIGTWLIGEKAKSQSIQSRFDESKVQDSFGFFTLFARSADACPDYGSATRDKYLRDIWKTEPIMAGAVYALVSKMRALGWSLEGGRNKVAQWSSILHEAENGAGWNVFISKVIEDYLCLAGSTRVHLGGNRKGKTKKICQIVQEQDPGPVISIDPQGHLVEQTITEWHITPLGNRHWWWLSLKEASGHSQRRPGGIFLTEDHPVLTNKGWKLACKVQEGDWVATGDPEPSEAQAQVLTGGLLGDLSISKSRKRAILRFGHCLYQKEWLDLKLGSLKGFQWTGYSVKQREGFKGYKCAPFVSVNSRASLGLNSWRLAWYPEKEKRICRTDIEKYFSPLMLAVWYGDDGTFHRSFTRAGNETSSWGCLYTCGFNLEDVKWLESFLTEKGLECRIRQQKSRNKNYFYLQFTCDGFRKLVKLIGAYLPPSLRYKLPDDAPQFNLELWNLEPAHAFFDEVIASRQRDYKQGSRIVKSTYHIGVAGTGCFIAAHTAVHNTTDNGAFIEFGLEYKNGPVSALFHIDSVRCQLLGAGITAYFDPDGGEKRLEPGEYAHFCSMPSPDENLKGKGFCFVSRALKAAKLLLALHNYEAEKLDNLPPEGIATITGMTVQQVEKAFELYKAKRQSRDQLTFPGILWLVGNPMAPGGAGQVKVDLTPFSSLPEQFNRESLVETYAKTLAADLGIDISEFWMPERGGFGPSKGEVTIEHAKARGKGPGEIISCLERIINWYVLPEGISFSFDEVDDEADMQRAQIHGTVIENITKMATPITPEGGIISISEARKLLVAEQILPEEYAYTEEETATDIEPKGRTEKILKKEERVKLHSTGKILWSPSKYDFYRDGPARLLAELKYYRRELVNARNLSNIKSN